MPLLRRWVGRYARDVQRTSGAGPGHGACAEEERHLAAIGVIPPAPAMTWSVLSLSRGSKPPARNSAPVENAARERDSQLRSFSIQEDVGVEHIDNSLAPWSPRHRAVHRHLAWGDAPNAHQRLSVGMHVARLEELCGTRQATLLRRTR